MPDHVHPWHIRKPWPLLVKALRLQGIRILHTGIPSLNQHLPRFAGRWRNLVQREGLSERSRSRQGSPLVVEADIAVTADGFHQATHGGVEPVPGPRSFPRRLHVVRHHGSKDNTLGQTIVKPTALGPVANTDTKLLIYGLFQKGRILAQDVELSGLGKRWSSFWQKSSEREVRGDPRTSRLLRLSYGSSPSFAKGCFTCSRVSILVPTSFWHRTGTPLLG